MMNLLTHCADGDTLFFFNYRSDRMRELVTVLGLPDRPMEVTVPKDLVCLVLFRYINLNSSAGNHDNVAL
jgi:bisphosphoglycerate-independent phosphoglycerate mutase (AlkP superfamily)